VLPRNSTHKLREKEPEQPRSQDGEERGDNIWWEVEVIVCGAGGRSLVMDPLRAILEPPVNKGSHSVIDRSDVGHDGANVPRE
jgi:hypothetical protein